MYFVIPDARRAAGEAISDPEARIPRRQVILQPKRLRVTSCLLIAIYITLQFLDPKVCAGLRCIGQLATADA